MDGYSVTVDSAKLIPVIEKKTKVIKNVRRKYRREPLLQMHILRLVLSEVRSLFETVLGTQNIHLWGPHRHMDFVSQIYQVLCNVMCEIEETAKGFRSNEDLFHAGVISRYEFDLAVEDATCLRDTLHQLLPPHYIEPLIDYIRINSNDPDEARYLEHHYVGMVSHELPNLVNEIKSRKNLISFLEKLEGTDSVKQLLDDCPDPSCVICQDQEFREDDNFTILDSCRHIFCTHCAGNWIQRNRTCPTCRREITACADSFYIRDNLFWKYDGSSVSTVQDMGWLG